MAQSTVVVLLHNLRRFLSQVNDLPGLEVVKDQVQWLCSKFQFMLTFLVFSERASSKFNELKQLVDEIRDLAHESEDVVDSYVSDVVAAKHRSISNSSTDPFSTLWIHIDEIINRINKCYDNRFKYGIRRKPEEMWTQDLLETRNWDIEEDLPIVSFTDDSDKLKNQLIKGTRDLDVMSIVGEGGIGKTTLAKKVYSDVLIKDCFRHRAWIWVSNQYRLRDLLLSIMTEDFMTDEDDDDKDVTDLMEEMYEMDELELKQLLWKRLRFRKYLIVLDDVWATKAWDELKDLFPQNKQGSRIILTTRFHDVGVAASSTNPNYGFLLEQRSLDEDESWELFCKKVFGEKSCPIHLEELGKTIVGRLCGGRPILIEVVATILAATKKTLLEWTNVFSLIAWKRESNSGDLQLHVLTLCFDFLPLHLKPCFLYLCIFPKGFEISAKQLIQLWIAEGLVQPVALEDGDENHGMEEEEVAEGYLEGLIARNMIQVTKRRSDGGAKSCRIHDFIRDMCINLSEKENFLKTYTGSSRDDCSTHAEKPRRLSILSDCRGYVSNSNTSSNSSCVRSFSCFSLDIKGVLKENWKALFKHLPLLRVLNFGEREVGNLPKAIKRLSHLKYLRVKPAKNISIPKSIFNLWNLQTIDLRGTRFPKLPEGIWMMKQLRHLYLDGASRLPKAQSEESCLPNLQTLSYISNDAERDIHISKKAPNLRKLGLFRYKCISKAEQEVTFNLPYLRSLKFAEECIFEDPINLPVTITKITVKGAPLHPNVIKMFEELPYLKILKLVQASFEHDELVFGEDSFPQLQLLKFEDSNIVTWKLEKGAMPCLRRLVISNCPLLTELSAQLWEADTLQELELFRASPTLAKKLSVELEENEGLKLVIYPAP